MFDAARRWIAGAEVVELGFAAFNAQQKSEQVPVRLVVRRISDVHAEAHTAARSGRWVAQCVARGFGGEHSVAATVVA